MEEKTFVWTPELAKRMLKIRFENKRLFEKRKQPWMEFHKLLMKKGFPEEMTVNHVRKKWSYHFETYKLAKRTNKTCRYFKLFDKHFGKNKFVDKYSSWPHEWRLKLITCISEVNQQKLDHETMWKCIENVMRSQDMPDDCCVHDMKGLWQHLKSTFTRKYRMTLRNAKDYCWPLYDAMMEYYSKNEPETLSRLATESQDFIIMGKGTKNYESSKCESGFDNDREFHWTKDITESFIQIRLQNDWLFREKAQPWKTFVNMLHEQYGFPASLGVRDINKKWTATYADYQKAKAKKTTSWIYYNLFELYLGEGSLSLNPTHDWKEEWLHRLINVRTGYEKEFQYHVKDPSRAWRLVEKSLRTMGIPLTHSLLDLPKIWTYLCRTYRWKRKFAMKGILHENWPYYEGMKKYMEERDKQIVQKEEHMDFDNDDYEDDIKLFDLKQQWETQVKPKVETECKCRACANVETYEQCVDIFQYRDDDGTDLAFKLKTVGGIEVDKSDSLTTQICLNCVHELENAYKFRKRCQNADRVLREDHAQQMQNIKTELLEIQFGDKTYDEQSEDDMERSEDVEQIVDNVADKQTIKNIKYESSLRPRKKYKRYEYWRVCDVCGKHTKNLKSHLDTHNAERLYSCDICDKKFKFKSSLFLHKAIHEPKTPRKTCEVCGKSFQMMAQYKKHFVYHANERKYACETCGKRFNSMDILRVHNRIHTDERPFSCPECGKTFRTAGCVGRHRRIVHKVKK